MMTFPFLTDLDSRAAVKGSRDPLGIQQIWTRLGRQVVGNLTTVSSSIRDFTTLLLGYHFAEQVAHEHGPGSELATFLKWEQLAAYARAWANKDFEFRGTERVRKNLSDGTRVTISHEQAHQILSNQKVYGLWGLYTMPARASGLVDGDPPRLTSPASLLVQEVYLPILAEGAGREARHICDVLAQKASRIDIERRDAALVKAIGQALRPRLLAREKVVLRFHLLHGGPLDATQGRQQQLAELLVDTLSQEDFAWSPAAVQDLVKRARKNGAAWHSLADRLRRILACERVLAPTAALFTYLLGLDGKSVTSVHERLREQWGPGLHTIDAKAFHDLRSEISAEDPDTGDRWVAAADALATGDYLALIDLLIVQNKIVMNGRGGAPWIEKRSGKLHVRFRDEQGGLPTRRGISSLWRFPYFLNSLRSIAATLEEGPDGS